MKATVTPDAEAAIADIARRHALSREAVLAMLYAIHAGGGTMAQFNIPELGGSGQWMQGGMTMVGNMFDNALKARVDALCAELSQLLGATRVFTAAADAAPVGFAAANWWPADLGVPSAAGGQNDVRYAIFPGIRRLAMQINGATKVFDTGEHQIGGVQQQQGGLAGTVTFTSQLGTFDVSSLRELGGHEAVQTPGAAPAPQPQAPATAPQADAAPPVTPQQPPPPPAAGASGDSAAIIAAIESLAGLHQRGILSDAEYAAKKAELLARL